MKKENVLKIFLKKLLVLIKIECSALETKLNILESKIHYRDDPEYIHCTEKLDKLYRGKLNSGII